MNEAAFIRAILASPEDDAPRLIFADWLDERGDPRAEYLRLLCAVDGLPEGDPRTAEMTARLRMLEAGIDLRWRALVIRGRRTRGQRAKAPRRPGARRSRREATEADVSLFLQQYARKAERGWDPNDRQYSREVEKVVKRMRPEELDRLMRGEDA
jgi:uncharacterized protein (TIGR02996 family)